jgi:uncharacterized protein Veg
MMESATRILSSHLQNNAMMTAVVSRSPYRSCSLSSTNWKEASSHLLHQHCYRDYTRPSSLSAAVGVVPTCTTVVTQRQRCHDYHYFHQWTIQQQRQYQHRQPQQQRQNVIDHNRKSLLINATSTYDRHRQHRYNHSLVVNIPPLIHWKFDRMYSTSTATTSASSSTTPTNVNIKNNNNNNNNTIVTQQQQQQHSPLAAGSVVLEEESFKIIKIDVTNGHLETVSYTPSEILTQTYLLPRDLVSLDLSSRRLHRRCRPRTRAGSSSGGGNATTSSSSSVATMRAPPAILPRRDCILLSFGPIRAVAERDYVYIFDSYNNQIAASFAMEVSQIYQFRAAAIIKQQQQVDTSNNKNSIGNDQTGDDSRNTTTTTTTSTKSTSQVVGYVHEEPPELVFLETILADVVDSSSRRIRIFTPIVDDLLLRVSTDEEFSGSGIHQLAPLKEQLQSFEVFVKQAYHCLTQLLNDDEEMLKLLLTEQAGTCGNNIGGWRYY